MTGFHMLLTPYQAQYYAWQLTRHAASNSLESLAPTLVNAQIDLNPHQVEAALFAYANPLSKGVILAVEKLHWQKRQRELETKRGKSRRELFRRQDNIDAQRNDLITELEDRLQQRVEGQVLFTIEWELDEI